MMTKTLIAVSVSMVTLLGVSSVQAAKSAEVSPKAETNFNTLNTTPSPKQVVAHYADIAHANYQDTLIQAKKLKTAIKVFLAKPTQAGLKAAKQAWLIARIPYQQSEVFRFGNKVVDDWEGQLNAWPLDEGFIDYVDTQGYQYELGNEGALLNLIAADKTIEVSGKAVDTSKITPELLASLNELGGSEANVATGYHAIEFLLWGQDLNGTNSGAGNRPITDYMTGKDCTHGHCERRAAYLLAVTELLITDLKYMVDQWSPAIKDNYRAELLNGDPQEGLRKMLYGMGSLALGELAGERIKVALEANSTEDEHDCFSDNTHNSHFYNAKGIQNIYLGEYQYVDGEKISGPSLADLVINQDVTKAQSVAEKFDKTRQSLSVMVRLAESGMAFDQMIAPNNSKGHKVAKDVIMALVQETQAIKEIAEIIGVKNLKPDVANHRF